MNEIPLHSSVLSGFRYDPDYYQRLWLRFRTGDLYVYQMVPATVIQALIEAPSHGNTSIRLFGAAIHVAAYLSAYGRKSLLRGEPQHGPCQRCWLARNVY